MFRSKPASTQGPMFTPSDIAALISQLQPLKSPAAATCSSPSPSDVQEPKAHLIRSRSGNNLLHSELSRARFSNLLLRSDASISLSTLALELGVDKASDLSWLLEGAGICFTRDRERILSVQQQNEVRESLRLDLEEGRQGGVRLAEWAGLGRWDISPRTAELLAGSIEGCEITDLHGFIWAASRLQRLRETIAQELGETSDAIVDVSAFKGDMALSNSWLVGVCQSLVEEDGNGIEGVVETKGGKVFFTPQSALSALREKEEMAVKQAMAEKVRALEEEGCCEVESTSGASLDAIEAAWRERRPEALLLRLGDSEASATLLAREDVLASRIEELVQSASKVATSIWAPRTPGQEPSYEPDTFISTLTDLNEATTRTKTSTSFTRVILSQPQSSSTIRTAFENTLAALQTNTATALSHLLRNKLIGPLNLYTAGVSSLVNSNNPDLATRVSEHILETTFRRLTLPEIISEIELHKLFPTTRTNVRELDRFFENSLGSTGNSNKAETSTNGSNSSNSSAKAPTIKSLPDLQSASARLARKLRVEASLSADELKDIKHAWIQDRLDGMKKMKRGSDVLQNLVWILLSTRREGVFASAGKDTSRMIKVVQADFASSASSADHNGEGDGDGASSKDKDDRALGKRLGELRDLVKEGRDGDRERKEMREMAKVAAEGFMAT
ncbi:hypothetical protein AAFC00_005842 [Neodothiora populina]|uniref:Uncharacterized protein n=1 Tax=Neodothiora populina TaxID=2781224 RepID=A0ABR3P6N8_9PEZI